MTGANSGPQRVRVPYVEQLIEQLSSRDWDIIDTIYRTHLATGTQLERLHFADLATPRSRSVMRWRVLKRLTDARVLVTLDRRIGASRHGSGKLCYALDSAGQRLVQLRANREAPEIRARRPWVPGDRFVHHTLAVTELYVALVERARLRQFVLAVFRAKADAHWPNGLGGWVRPDAFIRLECDRIADYWWYEADLGTESLPTIRAKLLAYLDFVYRGQVGPDGIVPRVLVGVVTSKRQASVQAAVNALPEPANVLFFVTILQDAPQVMIDELMKSDGG